MVLWAVTPSSGAEMAGTLQGGVVAFAAANLIPVSIGGIVLSLPPLLLTVALAGLLASTAKRGRFLPRGRYQETVSILVTTGVYALVVATTTRGLGPADAVPAGWVWTAAALALVATTAGHLRSGTAWHAWWVAIAPGWARYGVRGAGIGFGVMIAGGGIALSVGLIAHFGSAVSVAAIAAPSWMDGLGMAMLGLAFVPNAMIAGAGYVTAVGFEIGPGTYSPLAASTVDLPAVPLLAAAPEQAGRSLIGLLFLLIPAIAGYLIVIPAIRQLSTRAERLLAAVVGAVLTGVLLGGAAAIARGGVGDGRWSSFGAPPLLLAAVTVAEVGVVAIAFAVLTDIRSVPWRAEQAHPKPARAPRPRRARRAKSGCPGRVGRCGGHRRRAHRCRRKRCRGIDAEQVDQDFEIADVDSEDVDRDGDIEADRDSEEAAAPDDETLEQSARANDTDDQGSAPDPDRD